MQAALQAHDRMQLARIGYGTGNLYLNANRDAIDDKTRLWTQAPNLDYPSDKTLAVIKIESLDGDLIAVFMNYAMHANSLFLEGMISGDFPGMSAGAKIGHSAPRERVKGGAIPGQCGGVKVGQ